MVREKIAELMDGQPKSITPDNAEIFIAPVRGGQIVSANAKIAAQALLGNGVSGPTHRLATKEEVKALKEHFATEGQRIRAEDAKRNAKFQINLTPEMIAGAKTAQG